MKTKPYKTEHSEDSWCGVPGCPCGGREAFEGRRFHALGEPSENAVHAALGALPGSQPPTEHEVWQVRNALRAAYLIDFPRHDRP
jgi:hypothetical protein